MNRQAKKRRILAFLLLLAVVAGAWGNVLAAAFCPRIASARACCLKHKSHPSQSPETHDMHDMDMRETVDMQMGDMQMDMSAESTEEATTQKQIERLAEVEQSSEATAVDQPIETCAHCLSHSQLPLGSVTLRETESAKRSADVSAPQLVQIISFSALPSPTVNPREHAPPGDNSPRHVLINVFRI